MRWLAEMTVLYTAEQDIGSLQSVSNKVGGLLSLLVSNKVGGLLSLLVSNKVGSVLSLSVFDKVGGLLV